MNIDPYQHGKRGTVVLLLWSMGRSFRPQNMEEHMDILTILVMLGALATVLVLFRGIGSMAEGGEYDFQHSHQLMFARIGLQALTLLLVLIALLVHVK